MTKSKPSDEVDGRHAKGAEQQANGATSKGAISKGANGEGAMVGGTDDTGVTQGSRSGQHPGQNGVAAESTQSVAPLVTVELLKRDPEVIALLQSANEFMRSLGYTEHGQRHAGLVGHIAENVLSRLAYPERTCQLAHVAGYLHDIGNVVHRQNHAQSGALMAYSILSRYSLPTPEMTVVLNAIGNHEEERGTAITPISSAIIIADKADVHRSRVHNPDMAAFDIHDRVNYATTRSFVRVRPEERIISLELEIDTNFATVIEYFEIFLNRMTMMRQACEFLETRFHLIINETRFT
jgi:metal-dependent HD superfamily phosphatase/phosphodiesterase